MLLATALPAFAQVRFDPSSAAFPIAESSHATPILLDTAASETVQTVSAAFSLDVERVTGVRPPILTTLPQHAPQEILLVGVLGQSPRLDALVKAGKLDTKAIAGKWESAVTSTVDNPFPGVKRALVIAASDRRGAAYALFALSRQMGVSPWYWWADVPVPHHAAVYVTAANLVQPPPSVPYRGIFLNDEDWGLRPWAAKKMDPELHNIGPNTYIHVFELLLRLHANTLWPAMHPGTLAFNAVPENAKLADRWGIVMGSSHSEALMRNNVGEWDEKRAGPWNYQKNSSAMDAYWDKRLAENGRYENLYTVGLRGVHDTGLEATGSQQVKAALVEDVMKQQRKLLARRVGPDLAKIPQVIWLYKESLDLYRVGMKVPDDVTLGWTDDNYGYIRQLPNAQERKRSGGSAVYYHVSYWGSPHDYLWLCTTPPALIREEMTKAWDHGARREWILNVGDLKPAEADIDYFLQLATDEPAMAKVDQTAFLTRWAAEQFPALDAVAIAGLLDRYYALNFVRKPEFMGFNGYDDGINRTAFNPLAWGDENALRTADWLRLARAAGDIAAKVPAPYADSFFELVEYPIEAASAQNTKFLMTDRTFLDVSRHQDPAADASAARASYDAIQSLTARYNSLAGGRWDGMMSAKPRDRQVFNMPAVATEADARKPLPATWGAGDEASVISVNAAHFTRKSGDWRVLDHLGISGSSMVFGDPGSEASNQAASLDFEIASTTRGDATLQVHLLPTFAVDSDHHLRYAVSLDNQPPVELDETKDKDWAENVLRNDAIARVPLGNLSAGPHTLHFLYRDPGVILQHLVITYPNTPLAYPVPPETKR
jgi:hypothetical protein